MIATVYTDDVDARARWRSRSRSSRRSSLVPRARRPPRRWSTSLLGAAAWVALLEVGRRPGRRRPRDGPAHLRLPGRRAATSSGRRDLFRAFREQPTPELARAARVGARRGDLAERAAAAAATTRGRATSIVPLFALANAGHRDRRRLPAARASRSPITLGIVVGYVVGKPRRHRRRVAGS